MNLDKVVKYVRVWSYVLCVLVLMLLIYMFTFGFEFNRHNYPPLLMGIISTVIILGGISGFGIGIFALISKEYKRLLTSIGIFASTFLLMLFWTMLMLSPIH